MVLSLQLLILLQRARPQGVKAGMGALTVQKWINDSVDDLREREPWATPSRYGPLPPRRLTATLFNVSSG